MLSGNKIIIKGARVHNLKNIDVEIPKNKLVVITGVSGSGKSSLAFDTIYAEGQRRYVESLSAYARQFLGMMDKPDVDKIEGLNPTIAIDQKSVSKNPRSTVGTITEIYDYLRLLFSRVGVPHCSKCGKEVNRQTVGQIVDQIIKYTRTGTDTEWTNADKENKNDIKGRNDSRFLMVMGPVIKDKKGEHKGILEQIFKAGFARVRLDGQIWRVDEALDLDIDKNKKHSIEVIVDRLPIGENIERSRIMDSVETALKLGKGYMVVGKWQITNSESRNNKQLMVSNKQLATSDLLFSERFACGECGINMPEIEPRMFSFNSPHGACPDCTGLGYKLEVDPKLVIPNPRLTLAEGAIKPWMSASHRVGRQSWYWSILANLASANKFSLNIPFEKLSSQAGKVVLGAVVSNLQKRYRETDSDFTRQEIEKYMIIKECPSCCGKRLRAEALSVKVAGKTIDEISSMSAREAKAFFEASEKKLSNQDLKIVSPVIKEIVRRLQFLIDVGLDYLAIDRSSATLSGGEAQRIRLATQIGSGLSGVVYILDEPSCGLHQRDQKKLIGTLKYLRDMGNTVIVVEHDEQTIRAADHIIDIGPGAGENGGRLVAQGTPKEIAKTKTLTGEYLKNPKSEIRNPKPRIAERSSLRGRQIQNSKFKIQNLIVRGACHNNLKNIDVKIPLGRFVCVTGVSGSGKSTLVNDILAKALARQFHRAQAEPGQHKEIKGAEHLDKVIIIDQSPIGRTPRSNPATYTGAFNYIREIFALTQESRVRGYDAGRFSFNVKGGRCETCQGDGIKKIEMHFLPDVYVECEECRGKRYNKDVLEIEYKGVNISQVLEMSVDIALKYFKNIPALKQKLDTLADVGLGYIKLGQPAPTLSGGEAQRVKLATELSRKSTGRTIYILDEPTGGLHFDDIKKLLKVLRELARRGNTVLVIEHNLDVIRTADWLIDLGPEGGDKGGYIVAEGAPQDIVKIKKSYTGQWLNKNF